MAEFDFNGPAEIVQDKYQRSIDLADQALRESKSMQDAFNNLVLPTPTISVRWGTIAAPSCRKCRTCPSCPGGLYRAGQYAGRSGSGQPARCGGARL
jgi:hypothetical protein